MSLAPIHKRGAVMKRITTYISPIRVHWLIGELGSVGIKEIKVVEYFKPKSQVARVDLLCEEMVVEKICHTIHEVGTTGGLPDHMLFVKDFEPKQVDSAILGRRMGEIDD